MNNNKKRIILLFSVPFFCLLPNVGTDKKTNYGINAESCRNNVIIDVDETKQFSCSELLITLNEASSKLFSERQFKLKKIIDENIENLDFDNAKLIAGLNAYDKEATFSVPLINKCKEKAIENVKQFANVGCISYAGLNYTSTLTYLPNDPRISSQWSISSYNNNIKAKEAWDITKGEKFIRVGVIDDGISEHEDLKANLLPGYDFYNNNKVTSDSQNEHGTHVAGIIGALQDNKRSSDGPYIGVSGIAPNVNIVPLQASNNKDEYLDTRAILSAIDYATNLWGTDKQISVLNLSADGYGTSISILGRAKKFPGIFVWAAGNENENVDNQSYIDNFLCDNIISVGAVDSSLNRLVVRTSKGVKGSNYGNKVSIFAPGGKILSTVRNYDYESEDWSGTSMAAPHVAATAALIYSKYPHLTAKEVKESILEGARNITIKSPTYSEYNVKYLSVYGALQKASSKNSGGYAYLRIGINYKSGSTWTVQLINDNNKEVVATYNGKMCTESDGCNLTGLKHLEEVRIPKKSYVYVYIKENVAARFITAAITFNSGNYGVRYISYVNGLDYNSSSGGSTNAVKNHYQTQRLDFPSGSGFRFLSLSVVKRTGWFISYTYTIRITNRDYDGVYISYNQKMCFAGDAEMFNVSDVKDLYIAGSKSVDVTITSNGTAGYITASIRYSKNGFDKRWVTYANNLGSNSIGENKHSILTYLTNGVYAYDYGY